jgi:hypothetical protein
LLPRAGRAQTRTKSAVPHEITTVLVGFSPVLPLVNIVSSGVSSYHVNRGPDDSRLSGLGESSQSGTSFPESGTSYEFVVMHYASASTWMTIGGTFCRGIWLRSLRTPTILAPNSAGLPSTSARLSRRRCPLETAPLHSQQEARKPTRFSEKYSQRHTCRSK